MTYLLNAYFSDVFNVTRHTYSSFNTLFNQHTRQVIVSADRYKRDGK